MTFEIPGFTPRGILGRGGFGTVHQAADDAHGRDVAVKILARINDDSARRRFDRERRAMGTLSGHPNIGIVYTSGFTAAEEPYIVMEMITGGSLADRLERDGVFPPAEVAELGAALAEALDHAHNGGVLHLDLKPENILMSQFGRPKIVDFGIAALLNDESATSTIRATPSYADPEVLDGRPGTERSDVYGLAATLFTLLDGSPPYSAGPAGLYQVMRRVALDPVPTLSRDDVSPELAALLLRAMDKDPAKRPASMADFAKQFREVNAEPITVRHARRHPVAPTQAAPPPSQPAPPAHQPVAPQPQPQPPVAAAPVAAWYSGEVQQPNPQHYVITPQRVPQQQTPQQGWQPHAVAPFVPQGAVRKRPMKLVIGLSIMAVILGVVLAGLIAQRADIGSVDGPVDGPGTSPLSSSQVERLEDLGVNEFLVPNVVGLTSAEASSELRDASLSGSLGAHCFDTVSGQSPAAGEVVEFGVIVRLTYPDCVVPNFVGLEVAEAARIVEEEVTGLLVAWPAFCDDTVLGQSIAAGTVVEPGTNIDLTLQQVC